MKIRAIVTAAVVAVTCLSCAPHGQAATLNEAVTSIAKRVSSYLKAEGQEVIFVQGFEALTLDINSSGIEAKVKEAILKEGIRIDTDEFESEADWKLKAELSLDTSGPTPTQIIRIRLLDSGGGNRDSFREFVAKENEKEKKEKEKVGDSDDDPILDVSSDGEGAESKITSQKDVIENSNTNIDIGKAAQDATGIAPETPTPVPTTGAEADKLEANKKSANKAIQTAFGRSLTNPTFSIDDNGFEFRSAADSQFSVKIERARLNPGQTKPDSTQFQPVSVQNKKGRPFVDLKDGDFFRVIIKNGSSNDVGLELLLDGVNSLHFCKTDSIQKNGKWLIPGSDFSTNPPRVSSGVIDGWFRSADEGSKAFVISSEPLGVVAQYELNKKRIGTIQAIFYPTLPATNDTPNPFLVAVQGNLKSGDTAVAEGPPVKFSGELRKAKFSKNVLPHAILTVFHRNPDPPNNELPPQAGVNP